MTTAPAARPAEAVPPRAAAGPPSVLWVEPRLLRTSFASLRRGRVGAPLGGQAGEEPELPLRVAEGEVDGSYEVLDGFKRLERWVGAGAARVPVVVDAGARSPRESKRALLASNAPRRTLSVLDEARVVHSLRHDDRLGPKTIARLLGRKPAWVARRLTLATGLAPIVERRVDAGRIGPTLAHALCGLGVAEQEAVCASADEHGLSAREALALVAALRAAPAAERCGLLRDPLPAVRPARPGVPTRRLRRGSRSASRALAPRSSTSRT